MPRKYILLKQLYAKSPFPNPQVHFLIKTTSHQRPVHSAVPLDVGSVSLPEPCYLHVDFEGNNIDNMAVFVLAVGAGDRVASIGYVPLVLDCKTWEKKEYLKGIYEQNGFVIYSVRDQPFEQQRVEIGDNGHERVRDEIEIMGKGGEGQIRRQLTSGRQEKIGEERLQEIDEKESHIKSRSQPVLEQFGNKDTEPYLESEELPQFVSMQFQVQTQSTPQLTQRPSQTVEQGDASSGISIGHQEQVWQEASQLLHSHKAKNVQHKNELQELLQLQREQQEKLRQMGFRT